MEVASTVQPYEGEPRASKEDFDEVSKTVSRVQCFRSKLEHKALVTECLVCCLCVLFPWRNVC